ncbi:alpha/beta hydrolase [Spirosoma arcticum]
MKLASLLIINLLLTIGAFAQKTTITFRNPEDSAVNYYMTVMPVGPPKGLLVLLPGYGELPEYVYTETDLPKEAARQGLVTVIATLQQGFQSFYVDDISQQTLGDVIQDVQTTYKLTGKKLYIGGFSLGGSGAVRYAERAAASANLPRPNAVFSIDPPLDFVRMYDSMQKVKRQSKADVAVNEATFFTERMRQEFGGEPSSHLKEYLAKSPYCHSDTNRRNPNLLENTPIRLISEPDIEWQMTERNRDLYDMNTLDCVALITYLRAGGNTKAVYVQTSGKGYRKQQKVRNPHSWSIADPKATVAWLLRQ